MKQIGLLKALWLVRKADRITEAKRLDLQQARLKKLISYVKRNSPYYSKLYENIENTALLSDFPVTNKTQLMEHFNDWLTDRSITKEKVEFFMSDLSNIGKKLNGNYLVYSTSGSTGMPCIVLYDKTSINVSSAIGVLRSFARKEDMDAFMKSGKKTLALFADDGFYLGCGSVKYNLHKMPWKKNRMKTLDVRKPIPEIVAMLNNYQPSMIGCYPTAMELLSAEQEKGSLHIHPSIIMTGGEQLTDDVRKHLSSAFNCYVQTNYSCTEGGTIACECVEQHFHINDDWIIIEAVDDNNQPVPFGTQSAKLLLTNLANQICPIIRFEITDRVVLHSEPCLCGNTRPWLTLEGRTDDVLTFDNGVSIAPLSLYALIKEIYGVQHYQLIKTDGNRLELRLIAENKSQVFALAKQAIERYLQQNGVIATVHLSELLPQVNPISGKFKHIVSL